MQPLYMVITHTPRVPPVHYDFASDKETVGANLVVRALTWVMRVKDSLPLEHVQFWFADGSDTYLAERSATSANIWLCAPQTTLPIVEWSRQIIVDDSTAALDEYCEWRLNHGRVPSKHGNLEKLRQTREETEKQLETLALDLHNHEIGFFRRYQTLEQMHKQALKAQRATNSAASGLWNSQNLQNDCREALQQRQEVAELKSTLKGLQERAQKVFSTNKNDASVRELHRECIDLEAAIAKLEKNIDTIINHYHLGELGLKNALSKINETVAKQEQEVTEQEQRQQQAERNFEVFRRWLRVNSAAQRAEEIQEEHPHG